MTETRSQGRPKATRSQGRPTAAESRIIRATVLQALIEGHTHRAAAELAGITTDAVIRWLRQPEFITELNEAVELMWNDTQRIIKTRSSHALSILTREMANEVGTSNNRIAAARAFLEQARWWHEHDVSAEFAQLREAVAETLNSRGLRAVN
jgi:hypothetical protein